MSKTEELLSALTEYAFSSDAAQKMEEFQAQNVDQFEYIADPSQFDARYQSPRLHGASSKVSTAL